MITLTRELELSTQRKFHPTEAGKRIFGGKYH
jgi:hypothetical protein